MSCCAVPFMVHDGIPIAEATPAIAEVAAPPAASYHPRSAAVVVEAAPHTYFAEQEAAVAAVEAGNKQSIPLVFSPLWQVPAVEVHSAPLAPVASAVVDTDPAEDPDPD